MITIIVLIILILFFAYLFYSAFNSGLTLFINIAIIALTAGRASTDLKQQKMVGFYLASSLITVVMFIAKDTKFLAVIFDFFSKAYVIPISVALISILFFAHFLRLGKIYGKQLIENIEKKISEIRK